MDLRVNQLGEIIDISQNEAVKATNALWRSRIDVEYVSKERIKKRIDELKASREIDRRNHVDRTQIEAGIIALEGLLKEEKK